VLYWNDHEDRVSITPRALVASASAPVQYTTRRPDAAISRI